MDGANEGCIWVSGLALRPAMRPLGILVPRSSFITRPSVPVANLASRLCDQVQNGQILISERILADIEEFADVERMEDGLLKGFDNPVPMYDVVGINSIA